ncbi:hypothetical protein HaLaN_06282, partial [Haematococcus lacustris]
MAMVMTTAARLLSNTRAWQGSRRCGL